MKNNTTIKRRSLITLAMLVLVLAVLSLVRGKNSDSVVATPPVRTVHAVEEIWPASSSKILASQKMEYKPTINPELDDAYCVHSYTDGSYVYQYVGQTSKDNPDLSCS